MERGGAGNYPYFDPEFESLSERINPPRVSVDNKSCDDSTLVKVDSANRHGILLEMVQVLTDLDLVISKSYISSDGEWFMDVFHVTDQLGRKITDPGLVRYIEQSLVAGSRRRTTTAGEVRTCLGGVVNATLPANEYTVLELTGADRPGLLSEISAVVTDLGCNVASAKAWSHNTRIGMVMYLTCSHPADKGHLAHIEEQVENVLGAHHEPRGGRHVRLVGPTASYTHTERRLHQLMREDQVDDQHQGNAEEMRTRKKNRGAPAEKIETQVSIEYVRQKEEYSVVSVRSRDRPRLLFDTVCTLTDMNYAVSHASVSSRNLVASQEYFIRQIDGRALETEDERRKICRCLVAAIERRASHGLRLIVSTGNRKGLLSDITRVLREQGMSVTRAEVETRGERAMGTFFVTGTSGEEVGSEAVESVRREIGGAVALEVNRSPVWPPVKMNSGGQIGGCGNKTGGGGEEQRSRFSLGSLFWSGLERISNNLGSIRS